MCIIKSLITARTLLTGYLGRIICTVIRHNKHRNIFPRIILCVYTVNQVSYDRFLIPCGYNHCIFVILLCPLKLSRKKYTHYKIESMMKSKRAQNHTQHHIHRICIIIDTRQRIHYTAHYIHVIFHLCSLEYYLHIKLNRLFSPVLLNTRPSILIHNTHIRQ